MKHKRGISLTLTAALLLSMLPQIVLPKAAAANIPEREIDSSTYAALGLSLNAEDKGASLTAPYSKKHVSQAFTASEVYVAASGSQANRYLIRDGFGMADNTVFVADASGREDRWTRLSKTGVAWRLLSWLLSR